MSSSINYSTDLRMELLRRAEEFVVQHELEPQVYRSVGGTPTVLFKCVAEPGQSRHGNFHSASFGAIMRAPLWKQRIEKAHSQKSRALREQDRAEAKELDSCTSSDALLMNIFCHPGIRGNGRLASLLGFEFLPVPEFGFRAKLSFTDGTAEPRSTEIDMRLAGEGRVVLAESKLTERDFTECRKEHVRRYRGFDAVFDEKRLPEANGMFSHYQLIRNVLAAHHLSAWFCLLVDARRPDLQIAWNQIFYAILDPEVKKRCSLVTWQEIAKAVPDDLRPFLDLKYGLS